MILTSSLMLIPLALSLVANTPQIDSDADGRLDQAALAYGRPKANIRKAVVSKAVSPRMDRVFHSPEAKAVKEEICRVGWKLWMRSVSEEVIEDESEESAHRKTSAAFSTGPMLGGGSPETASG